MTTVCKNDGIDRCKIGWISDLDGNLTALILIEACLLTSLRCCKISYHDDLIARHATLGGLESMLVRRRSMNMHEMLATNSRFCRLPPFPVFSF
jgi:hypothetical protein